MLTDFWFWAFCSIALIAACVVAYTIGRVSGFNEGTNVGFRDGWRECEHHNRPRAKLTVLK